MELECCVKNYAWGKRGENSLVAQLKGCVARDFVINEEEPYAELWMGTHPSGSSIVAQTSVDLFTYLREKHLPFLLKVLSVKDALSIQAHPDKETAKLLNAQKPDIYKDSNHKPEMAIALTPFECLCGFLSINEIQQNVKNMDELKEVINDHELVEEFLALSASDTPAKCGDILKKVFNQLMKCSPEKLCECINSLRRKKLNNDDNHHSSDGKLDPLFLKLSEVYPSDVGCFVIFFVNYLKLRPGESIFIGANTLHAYLSGDCVECMASSDNVVRAGLTPKYMDKAVLCDILNYSSIEYDYDTSSTHFVRGVKESIKDTCCQLFLPSSNVSDFKMCEIRVPVFLSSKNFSLPIRKSHSISIFIEAEGARAKKRCKDGEEFSVCVNELTRGTVLFVEGGEEIVVESEENFKFSFLCYQAFS